MEDKHGYLVEEELNSELYYSSTLWQVVFQVLHYANLIVACAKTAWTALMYNSTICSMMHTHVRTPTHIVRIKPYIHIL